MVFNSVDFLVFFPVAAVGYYVIPHGFRYIWLLLCSYYFYMCWNPAYALLIMASTVTTYLSGIAMEWIEAKEWDDAVKSKRKKLCVAVSFIINLGILGYFKYFNFFLDNICTALAKFHISIEKPTADILLPVGISFYTFQALGYTVDVYRGEVRAEKNILKYALFVSFFPQLVAGPIERSGNLLRQIEERHTFQFEQVKDGLMLMVWGFFLKIVLADRAGIFVDAVYGDFVRYGGWYLIVASVLFAFQIYCDFAGYSIIAMGAAEVMGFRLTDNFNAPYLSRSVSEFWRRWHISLFRWFQDYIYIPLGGNRKGRARKYVNIMIVFLVSGLWHGASWAYVAWGALNGLYQVAGDLLKPVRDKIVEKFRLDRESFGHKFFQVLCTFVLVDITWVFFRAGDFSDAVEILGSMFRADNIWVLFDDSLFALGLDWKNFLVMLLSIALLLFADYLKYKGIVVRKALGRQELWFRWLVLISGIVGILVFGIWGSGYDASAFIYFQF